ncbi:MAG: hypothetical protein RLY20_518 [Verrucomicrobiota bacterium]|jgi:hypothetical protein
MKNIASFLLRGAPFVAVALLFTGCVGGVPRPVSATKVEYGRRLTAPDVAFIHPGVTTQAAVIAQLGTNYTSLPQQRAIAYSWEMQGGGWVWWWFVALPYGAAGDSGTTVGGWRAYFIAFDQHGVVTDTAFKSPSAGKSLHEHMYAWMKTLPAKRTLLPGGQIESSPASMLAGKPE